MRRHLKGAYLEELQPRGMRRLVPYLNGSEGEEQKCKVDRRFCWLKSEITKEEDYWLSIGTTPRLDEGVTPGGGCYYGINGWGAPMRSSNKQQLAVGAALAWK